MRYVFLIESVNTPYRRYVGLTFDLKRQLADHNAGRSRHTAKSMSRRLASYIASTDPLKAASVERSLKSGSGQAFANRRLW